LINIALLKGLQLPQDPKPSVNIISIEKLSLLETSVIIYECLKSFNHLLNLPISKTSKLS